MVFNLRGGEMSIGWFVDGAYVYKAYRDFLDYRKLREHIEGTIDDEIDEAYFFNADNGSGCTTKLHAALAMPAPAGPGLRVKTYSTQTRDLKWPAQFGGMPVVHPDRPDITYTQTVQKGVDVALAFHLIRSHGNRGWDKLVLAAGDADFFEPIVYLVEERNVELHLVGSLRSISHKLLPYARSIIQIDKSPIRESLQWYRQEAALECQAA
jgi:uncharacterized LabA/DUF88 family protein